MDIKSEKRWKTLPVIEYDIMYAGGIHDQITLLSDDRHAKTDDIHQFWIMDAKDPSKVSEYMECERRSILSIKRRDSVRRIEDTSPLPLI